MNLHLPQAKSQPSPPKALLTSSYLGHLGLSEDDCLALLVALDESSLSVSRRVAYLKERIEDLLQPLEWRHSVLNKAEDRLLRFWYLTRGTNVEMTDDGYKACFTRCSQLFGSSLFDTERVDKNKIFKFANSCVVVRTVAHKAVVVKPKKRTKEDLLKELVEL